MDRDRLALLARLAVDGGPELLAELRDAFEESTGRQVGALRASIARGDLPGIATAAHTLKGTAANFGATRLHDVASDLDQRARRGDLSDGPEFAELISRLRDDAVEMVRREWTRPPGSEADRR